MLPITNERRALRAALKLRRRCLAVSWLLRMGVSAVPMGTASRVLGVTRGRVRQLIEEGRLPIVGPMPRGQRVDRFIPVAALLEAPDDLSRGRPLMPGDGEKSPTRDVPRPNSWAPALVGPQSERSEKIISAGVR